MQTYASSSAFKEGHSIWIVPDQKYSNWNNKIDWHCNLLLTRTKHKAHRKLPDSWVESGLEEKLKLKTKNTPLSYTCITAKKNLPCEIIIEVPYSGNIMTWAAEIHKLSTNFKELPLRIFLPKGAEPSDFEDLWSWNKKHLSVVREVNS